MVTQAEATIRLKDRCKNQYYIFPDDIFYVQADNIYSYIICKGLSIHASHPIILMQELLPEYFIRIHRSFLINEHFIRALCRRTVIMTNGFCLPVPEKKYQWLREQLETMDLNIQYFNSCM